MKLKFKGFLVLFIVLAAQLTFAQERVVSGVVSDNTGLPLPGVSVLIKGAKTGIQTDFDGKYSIKAAPNQVLVFSYIGMKTQEVTASSSTLNIKLESLAVDLEGVVVTALGIKRDKKALGFGVSTVSSQDLIRSGTNNAIEGLAGKAAGVQVTSSGGVPGASSKIIIRGQKSITGSTDPLIIVDGVPFNNDTQANATDDSPFNTNLSGTNLSNRALDINPNDIESVTILKGGAAAALYGERAGNGVIIYTTKKGKSRPGIGVDLSFNTNVTTVNKLPELQKQYAAGSRGLYISPAQSGTDGLYGTGDAGETAGTQQSWGPLLSDVPGAQYYNNPDNFFQTGFGTDTNVAFYGGDEKGAFRSSFGYLKQEGMIPNSSLTRTNIYINGDRKLTEKLKVAASTAYIRTGTSMVQNGSNLGGIMLGLYRTPISYDLRNYKNDLGFQNTYFQIYDNPYYSAKENPYTSEVNRSYGNLSLILNQSKAINVTLRGSWDSTNDSRKQVYAISSFGNTAGDGTGQINIENMNTQIYNGDLIFNGLVKLSENIDLNYTAGGNLRSDFFTNQFSRGDILAIPGFYNLKNASAFRTSNYEEKIMARSLYAQADFSLYNQVYLTGSIRNDTNSTYGDKKTFSYPSGSIAWLFSQPLDKSWLNIGKIRFGYADVGIAPLPYYTQTYYDSLIQTDGYTDGNSMPYNGQNGFGYGSTLGQSELKPERVASTELGLELKMFDRLSFNINLYQSKSKDLLIKLPLAPSSGFQYQYGNYGTMTNKGIELEISYNIIKNDTFNWELSANWTKNKNEVTSIAPGIDNYEPETGIGNPQYVAIVGKPLGMLFGSDFLRDNAGNIILDDSGLPSADPTQKIIGDTNPEWLAGIRNTFTYKNLTLTALFDIRHGGDIWNGTRGRIQRYGLSEESAENRGGTYIIPGVHEDGTPNTTPVSPQDYFGQYKGDILDVQSQNVENVNWIRLRDVSLTYTFNKIQKGSLKFINNLSLTLTGRNLWLDTNYTGVDPETSLTGAGSKMQGFDYFNNPGSKAVSLAINVGL